jgi:hypothetical protein
MRKLVTRTARWAPLLIIFCWFIPTLISGLAAFKGGEVVNSGAFMFFLASIILLLLCTVFIFYRPIRTVIDENGISDREYGYVVIPWEDINGASIKRRFVGGQGFPMKHIHLDVADPNKYHSQFGEFRRAIYADRPIYLYGTGTNSSNKEMLKLIHSYIEHHKNNSNSENVS